MEEYTLDDLIEIFKRHSSQAREDSKKMVQQFKKENPDEKIPQWMVQSFYLSDALYHICLKIKELTKT